MGMRFTCSMAWYRCSALCGRVVTRLNCLLEPSATGVILASWILLVLEQEIERPHSIYKVAMKATKALLARSVWKGIAVLSIP